MSEGLVRRFSDFSPLLNSFEWVGGRNVPSDWQEGRQVGRRNPQMEIGVVTAAHWDALSIEARQHLINPRLRGLMLVGVIENKPVGYMTVQEYGPDPRLGELAFNFVEDHCREQGIGTDLRVAGARTAQQLGFAGTVEGMTGAFELVNDPLRLGERLWLRDVDAREFRARTSPLFLGGMDSLRVALGASREVGVPLTMIPKMHFEGGDVRAPQMGKSIPGWVYVRLRRYFDPWDVPTEAMQVKSVDEVRLAVMKATGARILEE